MSRSAKPVLSLRLAALAAIYVLCPHHSAQAAPQTFNSTLTGGWQNNGAGSATWLAVGPLPDHTFPIAGDTANINTGHTVDLLQNNATSGLSITGGTLSLSNFNLGVNGSATWNSGTIISATTNPRGSLDYSGPSFVLAGAGVKNLKGSINNTGTFLHQGTGSLVLMSNGGTFNNLAGGVYDFQSDADIVPIFNGGNLAYFNNFGLLRKSAGTDVSGLLSNPGFTDMFFQNIGGTIRVDTGTLSLPDVASYSGGSTFNVASGATLLVKGSGFIGVQIKDMFTGVGSGTVMLDGRFIAGTGGATLNFSNASTRFNGNLTATNAAPLTNISATPITFAAITLAGRLDNMGRVNQTGQLLFDGSVTGNVFNNLPTAVFDIQGSSVSIAGFGSAIFNNSGTFLKSGAASTGMSDSISFNNTGTIIVSSGSLILSGNTLSTSGTFIVNSGAMLDLHGGGASTATYVGIHTGSGGGTITLSRGQIVAGGSGATFNFPGDMFQFAGGFIRGTDSAPFINAGTITTAGNQNSPYFAGRIDNNGRIVVSGGVSLGTNADTCTFSNNAGGVFELRGANATVSSGIGSITTVFNNAGTILKTGTGLSNVSIAHFTNTGTFLVQSGTLNMLDGNYSGGTYTADAGAAILFQGGNAPAVFSGTLSGNPAGIINFVSGTLTAGASGATLNFSGQGFQWAPDAIETSLGGGANSPITNIGKFLLATPTSGDERDLVGRFDNAGTFTHRDLGTLDLVKGGAIFNNLSSGTYDLQTEVGLVSVSGTGAAPVFNNAGMFLKSVGTLNSSTHIASGIVFNNTGTVEVRQGTLRFAGAPTQASGTILTGGTWKVVGASTLDFAGGSNFSINQGTVILSGTGSTFTRITGLATNQGTFEVAGGRQFTTAGAFSNPGTVIANGTGSQFTVTGTLAQQSGSILTGGTWIARNGGTINLSGANIVTNQGTVILDGQTSSFPKFGTVTNNQGTLIITGGRNGGIGAFTNSGLIAVGPASTLSINAAMNSSGKLQVDGVLNVLTSSTLNEVTGTGTVNIGTSTTSNARHLRVGTFSILQSSTASILLGGGTAGTSRVNALSIAATGRLNLSDHALIVDYTGTSPASAVRTLLLSGFAGGSWNGTGLNSSAAASQANRALGYAEASDVGSPTTFAGLLIDPTSVLISFTIPGDTNLTGTVDIADFALLAANFNVSTARWSRGDFNYDGTTNITDFGLLAANFNRSLPAEPPRPTAVPEPYGAALVVSSLLAGSARNRFARGRRK